MNLREAREGKGLSQQQLATLTGLNQSHISSLERGVTEPTEGQKLLIERVLGVSVDWGGETGPLTLSERRRLIEAFWVMMERLGPQDAVNLLHSNKSNSALRKLSGIVDNSTVVQPYVTPTLQSLEAAEKRRRRG